MPNRNIESPLLSYLLYKYPNSNTSTNNLLTFPFKRWENKNKSPLNITNDLFQEILNYKNKCIGYINYNNNLYFFYNHKEKQKINKKFKNDSYWWGYIDEICNQKKIIYFPIHYNTFSIFYNYTRLIYLVNNNIKYEIPTICYFGNTIEVLSYIATFGIKSNPVRHFGPYYYYGNFRKMIAHSGWHSNYTKREIFGKYINNSDGKYKQGGLIRFALFLGNSKIILNKKSDPFYWIIKHNDSNLIHSKKNIESFDKKTYKFKGEWTKKYDSLILGNIAYKNISGYFNINTEYITKKHNQQIPLSIHLLDMSSLKNNWDPTYTKYKIK
jgi:hypothetical protein